MITLTVNGQSHSLDINPDMPLLWALRDIVGLTGTKYGCGIAVCGACTVHVDGSPVRSCITPVRAVEGKSITTIEQVDSPAANAVQTAWKDLEVAQCGYCQSGQIMSATSLLESNPNPTDDEINQAMGYNLCRCHTYARIRAAIHEAANTLSAQPAKSQNDEAATDKGGVA